MATDEESKRLRVEMSEMKARHRHELERARGDVVKTLKERTTNSMRWERGEMRGKGGVVGMHIGILGALGAPGKCFRFLPRFPA